MTENVGSQIKLIPFNLTDIREAEEMASIVQKYYPRTAWPPSAESIMRSSNRYFKAYKGNDYIGVSGYYLKTPLLAETVKTIVFEEFRGRGYGELLSQAIEDECRRIGVKKVMTTIYSFNIPMITIKLKQGYKIEGFHPDHEAPGFDEYSFGKVLK